MYLLSDASIAGVCGASAAQPSQGSADIDTAPDAHQPANFYTDTNRYTDTGFYGDGHGHEHTIAHGDIYTGTADGYAAASEAYEHAAADPADRDIYAGAAAAAAAEYASAVIFVSRWRRKRLA